jgi:steroid delta-isomerase-like uncharacterized protein
MKDQAVRTIQKYYDAFNRSSMEDFFEVLTEDVVHDINQGGQEVGKSPFRHFMDKANLHCKEKVVDLVIFANDAGTRGAAEFFVEGKYLVSVEGHPSARGQTYRLRCGAFFELHHNKISRVTTYYNKNEWTDLVT